MLTKITAVHSSDSVFVDDPIRAVPLSRVGASRGTTDFDCCVGTLESDRVTGTCLLLKDGTILTNLHLVFDIPRYAEMAHEAESTRGKVTDCFDRDGTIDVYFVKGDKLYVYPINLSTDLVGSGLPVFQRDTRFQAIGWDFAVLRPQHDILSDLGSPGLSMDLTDYTYGRTLGTDLPTVTVFVSRPDIFENTVSYYRFCQVYSSSGSESAGPLTIQMEHASPSIPSNSGSAVFRADGVIHLLKYQSSGGDVQIRDVVDQMGEASKLKVDPDMFRPLLRAGMGVYPLIPKDKPSIKSLKSKEKKLEIQAKLDAKTKDPSPGNFTPIEKSDYKSCKTEIVSIYAPFAIDAASQQCNSVDLGIASAFKGNTEHTLDFATISFTIPEGYMKLEGTIKAALKKMGMVGEKSLRVDLQSRVTFCLKGVHKDVREYAEWQVQGSFGDRQVSFGGVRHLTGASFTVQEFMEALTFSLANKTYGILSKDSKGKTVFATYQGLPES